MSVSVRQLVGVVLVVVSAAACNPTPGEGVFDAQELAYGGCEDADLMPWEPGFFTVSKFENDVTIRFQDIGGGVDDVDAIILQLDKKWVFDHLGEAISLGTPTEGKVRARATMAFYHTCPHSRVTPEFIGTVRFGRFSVENDEQITGQIDAPTIIDREGLYDPTQEPVGEVIGRDMVGEFDFLIQKGRPYTNFTGPGSEQSPF